MKPDLHTHTTSSDGLLTPAELVTLADKHRVTLLAVTDHDTFDGAAQLLENPPRCRFCKVLNCPCGI